MPSTADAISSPILLATRSAGKLRELRALFQEYHLDAIDLIGAGIPEHPDEDSIEQFETFEENAVAKARYFFDLSGMPTVADDSGLEVRALGGQPGVRSKRWSNREELAGLELDEANNARLLRELSGIPDHTARYVCVAAFVDGQRQLLRRGEVGGTILEERRGSRGFGYDPYFYSSELGCTFGDATLESKGLVSHRARAFRALLDALTGRVAG